MRKLNYKNNWENDEYYAGSDRISDLRQVLINGTFYDVTSKYVSIDYNDMGHRYSANSKHYFIEVNDQITGKLIKVDLNGYADKVTIYATEYTLDK